MVALIIVAVIALWVGSAWGLIVWYSQSGTGSVRRTISDRIVATNDSIRITIDAEPPVKVEAVGANDVVLLLDRSASMGATPGSPLREMIRSAEAFVLRLPDIIHVAIIAFDDSAECLCPFTGDKRRAVRAINAICPGGGTHIGAALARAGVELYRSRDTARRTVILFSDGFDSPEIVRAAAALLHDHPAAPAVYCASFGGTESLSLMERVAGRPDRVFHTLNFDGMKSLFTALASEITGQKATSGIFIENISAPLPFLLEEVGGTIPVHVEALDNKTTVSWPLPQFSGVATPVSYRLRTHCIGWFPVVTDSGEARWRMPDGSFETAPGARPSRVLVLPRYAILAWWLAHPLLLLALQPLLRCRLATTGQSDPTTVQPLAPPALPPPLPLPATPPYQIDLRSAVIIGLGTGGRKVLAELKGWLYDRTVTPGRVSLLSVDIGPSCRDVTGSPATLLGFDESLTLSGDLWPTLAPFRDAVLPETLSWLPLKRWFAQGQPLSSARGVDGDRAKARALMVLQDPLSLITAIKSRLVGRPRNPGTVIVVGAADEAVATGLMADVAHICAVEGHGVSALILRGEPGSTEQDGIAAFAHELERFLIRRGDPVISDRSGIAVRAHSLFNDAFVVGEPFAGAAQKITEATALLWALLACPRFTDRMPIPPQALVHQTTLHVRRAPQRALWDWVRERSLESIVCRDWLGITGTREVVSIPTPDAAVVRKFVDLFWSGKAAGRTLPESLVLAGKVYAGVLPAGALLSGGDTLPVSAPYHEQKAFCDRERASFGEYLEGWCRETLDDATKRRRAPVGDLKAAAVLIQTAFETLYEKVQPYADDHDSAPFVAFSSSILMECRTSLSRLVASLSAWDIAFFGGDGCTSVFARTISAQDDAKRRLDHWPGLAVRIEPQVRDWISVQSPNIIGQLSFLPVLRDNDGTIALVLRFFGGTLTPRDDIVATMGQVLDRYSPEVLAWVEANGTDANTQAPVSPGDWIGIGRRARELFGPSVDVVDERDPALAITASCPIIPIGQALGVSAAVERDRPGMLPYVWPEEANAAQVAMLIRTTLALEPTSFTPLSVSLLRSPAALFAILAEAASGRFELDAGSLVLRRGGKRFELARLKSNSLRLGDFAAAVDQAVTQATARDGTALPPPVFTTGDALNWNDDAETFVATLDGSPLGSALCNESGWGEWRDLARGVCLYVSAQGATRHATV